MTNREYVIKIINDVLEQSDDEKLADIFADVVGFPRACGACELYLHDEDENSRCDCTQYISKFLQSKDTPTRLL